MTTGGFFHDENGKLSMMRVHLTWVLVGTMALIWVDTLSGKDAPEPAYSLLALTITLLIGAVGGPRIMQHIGGQLGAIMQRAGGAASSWGSWGSSNGPAAPSTPEDIEP